MKYKGKKSPVRQYMTKKPSKWGIKIWCLADLLSKFVYNFDVYCGKTIQNIENPRALRGEGNLAKRNELELLDGLENKGHVVTMDNFFTSVDLFARLLERKIYASGTVRLNRVGLPSALTKTREFDQMPQSTLKWAMHESRQMTSVI